MESKARGAYHAVDFMTAEGLCMDDIDRMPIGVGIPVKEAIQYCQKSPLMKWPVESYRLIGMICYNSLRFSFLFVFCRSYRYCRTVY
jgi:hypothetical protein